MHIPRDPDKAQAWVEKKKEEALKPIDDYPKWEKFMDWLGTPKPWNNADPVASEAYVIALKGYQEAMAIKRASIANSRGNVEIHQHLHLHQDGGEQIYSKKTTNLLKHNKQLLIDAGIVDDT